ncbi:chemotaxis protein CheB [Shinella sp. S4-D37]|uniref:chemotaxis protein CheB n=1 Tax=Shinella sp. S4-D37 TaxID=3161999 RepID=UPI0034659D73
MADEPAGAHARRRPDAKSPGTKREGDEEAEGAASGGVRPAKAVDDGAVTATVVPVVAVGVGVGASAGGIEALGRFFDAMPADSGCAFVVVLHLDPKRESEMAHILGTRTAMPVAQVEDGMRLAPDRVYVIAPDTDLSVRDGGLHVSRPSRTRGQRHPVDVLFASLAADQRERAIAVVLSGTGSNGTQGLKEIRAAGGMSLVQAPETATFDGMPRSAISAGMADYVLAPEKMPETLLAYMSHGYVAAPVEIEATSPEGKATLEHVLELLHARGGRDFRSYKRTTLGRRVHRRLGLRNIATLDEYMDVLRASADEMLTLVGDLMISVTGFFRDAEAWKALAELVIAPMVAERASGASIRVWTPACSTGEEAYSIAMLITEHAEAAGKQFDLKVLATDVHEDNLRKARDGIYPEAATVAFPTPRLRRFFSKLDGSFQVTKELRDMVVFAPQNLLGDPPFSRLDLVSCRNVLIYLEPEAQQRIIALCHFALRPDGHLFLGNAETIGRHDDLFETVSKKWRIYRRIGPSRPDLVTYPPPRGTDETPRAGGPSRRLAEPSTPAAELARRVLLERYAPASVLIDRKGRVLYFHGTTRDYIENPPGEPTRHLLTMARDGLATKLRYAIREASRQEKSITVDARMRDGKSGRPVKMTAAPLPDSSQGSGLLIVSFIPGPPVDPAHAPTRETAGAASASERALQDELKATRAELQNTIDYMETAYEEMKASNEEATSMNEELQSTNEELETSKEELNTINSQLQHKIGELESATNDLNNLLAGSEIATLFLDTDFRIRWFTPATQDLFDLVSSDIGRPVAHFAQKFADENLLRDAEEVLKKLSTIEVEVPGYSGRWYARRMLPYRTRDDRIAGVVITFNDVSDQKHAAGAVNEARKASLASEERLRLALEAGQLGSWELDVTTGTAVRSLRHDEIFGYETLLPEWSYQIFVRHILPEDRDEVDRRFRTAIETGNEWNFQCRIQRLDSEIRWIEVSGRPAREADGTVTRMSGIVADITERRESELHAQRLAAIVRSSEDAIISKDMDGTIVSWNQGAERLFGYSNDEIVGKSVMTLIPPDRHAEEAGIMDRVRRGDHIQHYETIRQRKDGSSVWVSLSISPIQDARGVVIGASKIARDTTERRLADEHRQILVGELNHRVKNTLAVVQSIASQTLGGASSMAEARDAFSSRLMNLAKTHDVLTRESWTGANLADIVADTIKPHAGGQSRFRIEGPCLQLAPSAALAVSMALHELSTNAAKYGALSTDMGRVEIFWRVEGDGEMRRLALRWRESGGPDVIKPTRKGFGSRLIGRALATELGGKVRVEYKPSGVVCTIVAPLPHAGDVGRPSEPPASETDPDR